jgi:hypothetical protein
MAGDERVRHCTLCSLNVYNFAEMTREEVRELLARTEGRVCARLYRRAGGTVLTRDCPLVEDHERGILSLYSEEFRLELPRQSTRKQAGRRPTEHR